MSTIQVSVERFSLTSRKSFDSVVAKLQAATGHPDMAVFGKQVAAAANCNELEAMINKVVGVTGLMEFTRFDIGEVLRKEQGEKARKSVRLVVGNPLIMKRMVEHVPDAASYAPVTILVDERSDGVHLSYDRMATFLTPYQNEKALKVAEDLDSKVEALLTAAAS